MSTPEIAKKDLRIVVYTAIFGPEDFLQEPRFVPPGVDFVCFTDQPFRSKHWQIRKVAPHDPTDLTRSNRKLKILAHQYLPEYEYSVYVDGNMIVRGDVRELITKYLGDANMAFFDHAKIKTMQCDCIYDEEQTLLELHRKGKGKEDPVIIRKQLEHYRQDGFPAHNGLITGMVIVRRHHAKDTIAAMEAWWKELNTWSKRDQLSFNYIAWKNNFHFRYMEGDSIDNPYFRRVSHYLPFHRRVIARAHGVRVRIKKLMKKSKGSD